MGAQADVDDAHAKARNALEALKNIPIGTLNDTEREHAVAALRDLHALDEALAERSETPTEPLGMEIIGNGGGGDDA